MEVGPVGLCRVDLPTLGDEPTTSRFNLAELFDTVRVDLPLELEIGSGKGTFLVDQAEAKPGVNFVGLEYARQFWLYAADRCRRHGFKNVRLIHEDANVLVHWYAADAIFDQAHVYFPDPWPKKRHHKRRLLCETFFRQLHRTLKGQATVRIVTDHEDYFEWINEHAQNVRDLFETIPFQSVRDAEDGQIVGTNFERKYRREGRPFHALSLQKR